MRFKAYVFLAFCLNFWKVVQSQHYTDHQYEPDMLDMDPDSILEENARITTNATCGIDSREYYCRLVEHAHNYNGYGPRSERMSYPSDQHRRAEQSYVDEHGQRIQCNYCDDRDPRLRHPIEYVIRGENDLWWQSPSLAEGLQYQQVTVTMDFKQVYQIVYVLLRMGDSPRPANWVLERSLDGDTYKPWVFFAESEHACRRLYEPLLDGVPLTVTSSPRPWKLDDDETYCTTYYSQPESLQSGEIIVTLPLDRASTMAGTGELERAVSSKLIDFLSARYIRLRFQKLQTLSGDWMTMPNQLDQSVYNRYYYTLRTIKVGGKCICNSHANACEQQIIDGVPRAVCVCQHNTCGSNCQTCCPLFNQLPWRPGRVCEECNCNRKADSCVFNQTVANLRLSMHISGVHEGGGICVDCKENTDGINCEKCKLGYYRPINRRPEESFPCVPCECNSHGSTQECISNDALVPEHYPGDCICKTGFAGKKCDECAIGYRRPSPGSPDCVPCSCDIRGSHGGGSYRCEPPCNCKINVNPDSNCKTCRSGFFNLDVDNPEGCQPCYCSGLTKQCDKVSRVTAMMLERKQLLGTVSTLNEWTIIVPSTKSDSRYSVKQQSGAVLFPSAYDGDAYPLTVSTQPIEAWLSSVNANGDGVVDRAYYWSAPQAYLGNQITAYRGKLAIIQSFSSPTMTHYFTRSPQGGRSHAMRDYLDQIWLNEPDVVLEGNGYRLAYFLPPDQRDSHLIVDIPLRASSFRVLVEPPSSIPLNRLPISLAQGNGANNRMGRPATVGDIISVLADLERLLIKAKYTNDQSQTELRSVKLVRATRNKDGDIDSLEECVCPHEHTGTSCESCAPGFWRARKAGNTTLAIDSIQPGAYGMWRSALVSSNSTAPDTSISSSSSSSSGSPALTTGLCIPCECHGHSDTCHQNTGQCIECQHNTAGDKCEECAPGFYGDPSTGDPNACKPCACPTLLHQMTKECIAFDQSSGQGQTDKLYACLDCQENTRGRYCEICAEGYHGDPSKGIECKRCDCGIGAVGCDEVTGECTCGMHTTGPRCEACAEGTHGDPLTGQPCRPCDCQVNGSMSRTCRLGDGQCSCKPNYEGLRCDRCVAGHGNVEAGCPVCKCDLIGTRPEAIRRCDSVTGKCDCKPGVGNSLDCSKCEAGFYDLGPNGCKQCKCSSKAVDLICDSDTGDCKCGEHVIGDTCDKCEAGHYWNATGPDCLACDCGLGALTSSSGWSSASATECDMQNGQCSCAEHVTGRRCDECKPGYFGVSPTGCQPCPSCPNGQVCDKMTGKCICPINTKGDQCEECSPNSWDYNPIKGCKSCNCSTVGTQDDALDTCDLISGQCSCKSGFAGRNCSECALGFFGYPSCTKCDCDAAGSARLGDATTSEVVPCNPKDGTCQCKSNVQGTRCDECKPGTFGLDMDYEHGCYSCFCFPTSPSDDETPKCTQLKDYLSVPAKGKEVEIIATDNQNSPSGPLIDLHIGLREEQLGDLVFGASQFSWRFSATRPTYMDIPELTGHLTRSYGNILVGVWSECLPSGNCRLYPPKYGTPQAMVAFDGPPDQAGSFIVRDLHRIEAKMIALSGYLELEYQPAEEPGNEEPGYRHIWMRERDWILTRVGEYSTRVHPTRNELMLALMNVTTVSVRIFMPEANPTFVRVKYQIYDALSERTTLTGTPIRTVEKCECPTTALGDHCELAANGFFFPQILPQPGPNLLPEGGDHKPEPPSKAPHYENVVWSGGAEKCNCHGMSSNCDPDTGVCLGCSGNTVGPDCGECAVGYMGDPKSNQACVKCQCPTEQTDYAETCIQTGERPFSSHRCVCKPGYSGERCEKCAVGYYGQPTSLIACQPCDCDPDGSQNVQQCDQTTGQCKCWSGIMGRRCDQCKPDHVVEDRICRDCRGPCTGELLEKADEVKVQINNLNMTSLAYRGLERLEDKISQLRNRFDSNKLIDERAFIMQTQQLATETFQLENKLRMLFAKQRHLDDSLCQQLLPAMESVVKSVDAVDRSVLDWMKRLKGQSTQQPDATRLADWQEQARRALLMLTESGGETNSTVDWLSAIAGQARLLVDAVAKLKSDMGGEVRQWVLHLDRTASYQREQKDVIDAIVDELKLVANATQYAADETKQAEETAANLQSAIDRALNVTVMKQFNESALKLPKLIDELESMNSDENSPLSRGKASLDKLAAAMGKSLPGGISQFTLPPSLVQKFVKPLERESMSITSILSETNQLKKILEARTAYADIVNNVKAVINSTNAAENALANATASSGTDIPEQVKASRERLQPVVEHREELYMVYNKTGDDSVQQVDGIEGKLAMLSGTMDKTIENANDVSANVGKVNKLIKDIKPLADNASDLTKEQRSQLDDMEGRLLQAENKFAALHGNAQHAVDQANTTQLNLATDLTEAEASILKLDTKLLRVRRLAAEARSLLDVTYGALAKDPSPIKFTGDCVYTLVPYSTSSSQVFDIEFWFNLARIKELEPTSHIMLVGRRGYNGRTSMFAFTAEDHGSRLKFAWNVEDGEMTIDGLKPSNWYQVRVSAHAGTTRMSVVERPNQDDQLPSSAIKEVSSQAGLNQPETWLALDKQTELRIGGAIQQPSRLVSPEAWGDNGAEELWSRLLVQEPAHFCIFDLRLGGTKLSLVDMAAASPGCKKPSTFECQIWLNYRPYVRDGYIWRQQALPLTSVTNVSRPSQSVGFNSVLRRMFYYDFSGTSNAYARVEQLADLQFCKHRIHFQATPVDQAKATHMTVMTFYNFDEDTGTTVEMINGQLQASSWNGANLYKRQPSDGIEPRLEPTRRRMLRSINLLSSSSARRSDGKRRATLSLVDPSVNLWRLDAVLSKECDGDMVLFMGGIPPGYFAMRRRMQELGLTLNTFHGRIGLTNQDSGYDGEFFLYDYQKEPANKFGGTRYTDLRQKSESRVIENRRPDAQFCMELGPHDKYTEIELVRSKISWPLERGLSMTVRFDPTLKLENDFDLVSIQMASADWFRISLTKDYKLSIVYPGAESKLVSEATLLDFATGDPGARLNSLELGDAKLVNASLPAWSMPSTDTASDASSTSGPIWERSIALAFRSTDHLVQLLIDKQLVQSWQLDSSACSAVSSAAEGPIQQLFVGPNSKPRSTIGINYLVIDERLIDFATDISTGTVRHPGAKYGNCGGQLHPRFIKHSSPSGAVWLFQGLELDPPRAGRASQLVKPSAESSQDVPSGSDDVSGETATGGAAERSRRLEDCVSDAANSASFDQSSESFWKIDLQRPEKHSEKGMKFSIGFRAYVGDMTTAAKSTTNGKAAYTLLAGFNYEDEAENWYIVLGKSQLILVHRSNGLMWTSPHVTLSSNNWHSLTIERQPEQNELIGQSSPYKLTFDGQHHMLPDLQLKGYPSSVEIGGSDSMTPLHLNSVRVSGLFGCIDQLSFSDQTAIRVSNSGRPKCADCFKIDPRMVHILPSLAVVAKNSPIALTVPPDLLGSNFKRLTFTFRFFYDRTKVTKASLFLFKFATEEGPLKLWFYVKNNFVYMTFLGTDENYPDSVGLLNLPAGKNTWHMIKADIIPTTSNVLAIMRSSVSQMPLIKASGKMEGLDNIYFGYDEVSTLDEMKEVESAFTGDLFTGCLRDVQIVRDGSDPQLVEFPTDVSDDVKQGVCETSKIW